MKNYFYFKAEKEDVNICLKTYNNPDPISLQTSTDGENWSEEITFNTNDKDQFLAKVNASQKLYIRRKSGQSINFSSYRNGEFNSWSFAMNEDDRDYDSHPEIEIGGNIMSLIDSKFEEKNKLTNIGEGCFEGLFYDFLYLKDASNLLLPATNLGASCYLHMFCGCEDLEKGPELPAENLEDADGCYKEMFNSCKKLKEAPALPSTKLSSSCYQLMFNSCESLKVAPLLPATELVDQCYYGMFDGCKNLQELTILAEDYTKESVINDEDEDTKFLSGTSSKLTVCIKPSLLRGRSENDIKDDFGMNRSSQISVMYDSDYLAFTASKGDVEVSMEHVGKPDSLEIEVSNDKIKWEYIKLDKIKSAAVKFATIKDGDTLYLRRKGDAKDSFSRGAENNYWHFSTKGDGELTISGTVLSLLDPACDEAIEILDNCFAHLFDSCKNIVSADKLKLPSQGLSENCYAYMFANCTGLTTPPELPNTELPNGAINGMFKGCSSLKSLRIYQTVLTAKDLLRGTHNEFTLYCQKELLENKGANNLLKEFGIQTCAFYSINDNKPFADEHDYFAFTSTEGDVEIGMCSEFSHKAITLQTSSDKIIWNEPITFDEDKKEIFLCKVLSGETIYLRNTTDDNNIQYIRGEEDETRFTTKGTGKLSLSGDILSLVNIQCEQKELADYCFSHLFEFCENIYYADKLNLPSQKLSVGCFISMFNGCKNLVTAPKLPARELTDSCYDGMFSKCSNLIEAPELPAEQIAESCYCNMFRECTSLLTAPELPAKKLAYECYAFMFCGCKSLTEAPELPATELEPYCYHTMFADCENLIKAPKLIATELKDVCYYAMFAGCKKLNSLYVYANEVPDCILGSTGEDLMYYCKKEIYKNHSVLELIHRLGNDICSFFTIDEKQPIIDDFDYFAFTADEGDVEIGLRCEREVKPISLLTSFDKIKWSTPITFDRENGEKQTLCKLESGHTVYIRISHNSNSFYTEEGEWYFTTNGKGKLSLSGNIMSLTHDPFEPNNLPSHCFEDLFLECENIHSAEDLILPSTHLSDECYHSMFCGCKNLVTAPQLPATELAYMCYSNMFNGCESLAIAPELPATELAKWCYANMFEGCKELKEAPELPATELAQSCYDFMFQDCKNLQSIHLYANDMTCAGMLRGTREGIELYCKKELVKTVGVSGLLSNVDNDSCVLYSIDDKQPLIDKLNYFALTAKRGDVKVSMVCQGTPASHTFEVSLDKIFWNDVFLKNEKKDEQLLVKIPSGKTAYIRYKGKTIDALSKDTTAIWNFAMEGEGKIILSGNIMSLLDAECKSVTLGEYSFSCLFSGCTNIISASNLILPATELSKYCYASMFQGCKNMVEAPDLPATEMANSCYLCMFQDCESLTAAPRMEIKKTAAWCCVSMFYNCYKLETTPTLLANEVFTVSYSSMFKNCASLKKAPQLPATKLGTLCYGDMFSGCTRLEVAPKLPATTLADQCYQSMFSGCTNLQTAPELPATEIKGDCYKYMFLNCSSLITAPELKAKTTGTGSCYKYMFSGCSNLGSLKLHALDLGSSCDNMLEGVKTPFTLYCNKELVDKVGYDILKEQLMLKEASICNFNGSEITDNKDYFAFKAIGGTVDISFVGTNNAPSFKLQLSLDKKNWNKEIELNAAVSKNTKVISLANGQTVYLKRPWSGLNEQYVSMDSERYWKFQTSGNGKLEVKGNIMSLLDRRCEQDYMVKYAFYRLFSGCKNINKAGELILPVKKLTSNCYEEMFDGCSNLEFAPKLPATSIAENCYKHMFNGCSSMRIGPELKATTLATSCYYGMFRNCTSLTSVSQLPATTLKENCYHTMFRDCKSLQIAPSLPATTLAKSCYESMFRGCTSLKSAPSLPAQYMVDNCYAYMFAECINLTSKPAMSLTDSSQLDKMQAFYGCAGIQKTEEAQKLQKHPTSLRIEIHNGAKVPLGGQLYVDFWYSTFKIVDGKKVPVQKETKWNHKWTERGTYPTGIVLPAGEHFEPEIEIRITHKHGKGPAYSSQESSRGYINIMDGILRLDIGGSACRGKSDPYFKAEAGCKVLSRKK